MSKPNKRLLPEAFHPSEYILEEAKTRGWSMKVLAAQLEYKYSSLRKVLGGKSPVDPYLAKRLGEVFGTGSAVWLNLQAMYDLTKMIERKRNRTESEVKSEENRA